MLWLWIKKVVAVTLNSNTASISAPNNPLLLSIAIYVCGIGYTSDVNLNVMSLKFSCAIAKA
jgi:hypothetical protein